MLAIQGAADGQAAAIEDVGVNHRRFHVLVAKEFLHRADIVAILQQMRSKGVAEGVAVTRLLSPARLAALLTALCRLLSCT